MTIVSDLLLFITLPLKVVYSSIKSPEVQYNGLMYPELYRWLGAQ